MDIFFHSILRNGCNYLCVRKTVDLPIQFYALHSWNVIVITSIPGLNSEGILEKALFTNYSKNVRPVSDYHEQLEVHLTYNLGKIEQLVSDFL